MTTALHPKLIEEAAAFLAAADSPLPSSRVTLHLTHFMRKVVENTDGLAEEDVMVYANSYPGHEVPNGWMPRIAKAVGAVELPKEYTVGRRKERMWALPAKVAEWDAAATARAIGHQEAASRVRVWTPPDGTTIAVDVDGQRAATYEVNHLGHALASEQADGLARKLRNALVDAATAEQVAVG